MTRKSNHLPGVVDFLRDLDFEIGLDFDGQVIIEYPESLNPKDVANELSKYSDSIRKELTARATMQRRQFVGGPLNGNRHGHFAWCGNTVIAVRICRAKWACYEITDHADGRAWFRGFATSEAKAKRKELAKS